MRKTWIIAMAAAAAALAGCSREIQGPDAPRAFRAAIETPTRVAFSDEGAFSWQEADAIAVSTNAGFKTFTLTDGAGASVAKFDGDLSGVTSATVAVYPASVAKDDATVTLPAEYAWKEGQTNAAMFCDKVRLTEVNSFKHLGGIIKVSFAEIPADADAMVLKADAKITGDFAIANGQIAAGAGTDEVKVTFAAGSNPAAFYIPVPTGEYKFAVELQKAGAAIEGTQKATSKAIKIGRKALVMMNPVGPQKITIATAEDLVNFLAAADTYDEKDEATVTADISMSGVTFTPATDFKGSFDGGGKTISGIAATTPLFLKNSGTIKNFTLEGAFAANAADQLVILAPVARNYGTLEGITNKASVTVTLPQNASAGSPAGVNVAGIAGESYGPISNCTNNGDITAKGDMFDSWAMVASGIVGFLGAPIEGCANYGKVEMTAGQPIGRTPGMTEISMMYDPVSTVAGIASYAVSDADHAVTVTACDNHGDISFYFNKLTAGTSPVSRVPAAGIVGNAGGDIIRCKNYGKITHVIVAEDRATAYNAQTIIMHTAGITGGDYFVKKINAAADQNETNIVDCINAGAIYVDSDLTKSNSVVGGIAAWPAAEKASITAIRDCTNSGDIHVDGLMKVRVGGITGGTNSVEGCKNTGSILVNKSNAASCFGLLQGFHSQSHTAVDCQVTGTIRIENMLTGTGGGIGGLFGAVGNVKNTLGQNCKVNAELIGNGTSQVGLIVGHLNGKTADVTFGTEESPVKVGGTVDGVAITAGNFQDYLHHASQYTASRHVFNVVFDGTPVQ